MKRDVIALRLAGRDPRTPWGVKLLAGAVAAYALSPIDLIPDFIPVLGFLDDIILVPFGVWLAVRLMPAPLMAEFRLRAQSLDKRPSSRIAAAAIVLFWLMVIALLFWAMWPAPVH